MSEIREYDLPADGCPLKLGTPLRSPEFAWPAWGITWQSDNERAELLALSERAYFDEWEQSAEGSHEAIRHAAERAGLGSANQLLNAEIARISSIVLNDNGREIEVLDLGAGTGTTTLAVWQDLPTDIRLNTRWTLMDPAKFALDEAKRRLNDAGMTAGHYKLDNRRDLDALAAYAGKFDLIVSAAAIHHHARLEGVMAGIASALKPGGCALIGDWHNHLSTHPAAVRSLLEALQWPQKESYLRMFDSRFPASVDASKLTERENEDTANNQITEFWKCYAEQSSGQHGLVVLEGHRPVNYYIEGLRAAGLVIPITLPDGSANNPKTLLPDSSLLCVILAQRPIETR